jgi:hypothetical protein
MDNKKLWKKTYRLLLVWGVIVLVTLFVLFIGSYPEIPKGLNRWILVLLIGPPLWLVGSLLFERFVAKPTLDALHRVADKRIRLVNTILAGIIVVPVLVLMLIALLFSLFK